MELVIQRRVRCLWPLLLDSFPTVAERVLNGRALVEDGRVERDRRSAHDIRVAVRAKMGDRPPATPVKAPFLNDDVPSFLRRLHEFEKRSKTVPGIVR